MQTGEVKARFRAEAEALGLPEEVIEQQWPMHEKKKTTKHARLRARRERRAAEAEAEAEAEEVAAEDVISGAQQESLAVRRRRDRRAHVPELNFSPAEKHQRVHHHVQNILKNRLAPVKDKKVVEKLALREVERERHLYKTFGDKKTLVRFNQEMEKEFNKLQERRAMAELQKRALNRGARKTEGEEEVRRSKGKGVLSRVLGKMSARKRAEALEQYKLQHRIEWLARYKAVQAFKEKEARRRAAAGESNLVVGKQEVPRRVVEEEKDWADLAQVEKSV
jgi:hypothetical protein